MPARGGLMVRGLTLAVALALGTVTVPAHALGLGDIKATSSLNQEFKADIDLLSVAKGELDGVRIKLADQSEFARAGVERPFFLTLLKFRTERLKNGKAVIHVSSDFPVREPFLDFLVEINWPRGRLIREYTVLLDPPATTRRHAPRVQAAPARTTTSRAAPVASKPVVQATAGGEYGPVAANETLWSIAKKLRPRGASMEQMMMALKRVNPEAFIGGDINRLRKGQVLRVPVSDEILSISRSQARQAYREAQEQWLTRKAERLQAQAEQAGKEAALAKAPEGAAGTEGKPADELRIATARPEGEGEAGASEDKGDETIEQLKQKLLLARENAESSRVESDTLRNEIADMQKRLEDMQRLITLKDNQLAQLQAGVAPEAAPVVAPGAASEPNPVEQAMQEAEQAAGAETTAAESAEGGAAAEDELAAAADLVIDQENAGEEASAPAAQATTPEAATEPPVAAEKPGSEEELVVAGATEEPKAAEPAPKPAPAPAVEPVTPKPAPGLLDSLLGKNLPYVAGGGGILVLLLLLLLMRRGKSEEVAEAADETPSPAGGEPESGPAETETQEPEAAAEETSFLSEFSPSEVNALRDESGEVDPVAEADVYIAYGRYQQAEDLLEQAMQNEPDRLAFKRKLLEVYYATRNKDAFNALAKGMVDGGQDIADPEGRELDPDNGLYAESDQLASVLTDMDVDAEGGMAPDDDEMSELASELIDETLDDIETEEELLADAVDEPSLDIEDLKELEGLDDLDDESLSLEDLESLDLDLAEDAATVTEQETSDSALTVETLELPSMDEHLPPSNDLETEEEDLEAQLDELSDLSSLDADLGQLTEDLSDESVSASTEEQVLDQPISLDEAFEKDLDNEEADLDIESLAPESESVDAGAVETKLDLAKAFVEMGDGEGARDILEEVLKEGNEEQRQTAQQLLDDIA